MTLAELIGPDRVFEKLRVADKSALIAELGRRAGRSPRPITRRHHRQPDGAGAFGLNRRGRRHRRAPCAAGGAARPGRVFRAAARPIDYAAIDGRPVDLVFLLLSPTDNHAAHLAALAAMSRRLRDKTLAAAIRAADSPAEIRACLIGEGEIRSAG